MADIDLTAAVLAAIAEIDKPENGFQYTRGNLLVRDVEMILLAALPEIRRQLAEEIRAFAKEAAKTDSVDAVLGLIAAAVIVAGKGYPTIDALADELDGALVRGENPGGDRD